MLRGAAAVSCALLCACGRFGFDTPNATSEEKPDAAETIDADPTIDAPIGMGSYTVTETSMPYVALDTADVAPAFAPGDDEALYTLELPFTFRYYGIDYTKVSISINGYVAFGAPAASPETYLNDCPIDGSAPDAMIAVFWDDLFASKMIMPYGVVRFAIAGATPNRALEVEWHDVDAYYHAGGGNNFFSQGIRITQKVVLHETGVIDLHYGPRTGSSETKDCGTQRYVGCSATVGLRAPSSSAKQTVQCGTELGFTGGAQPLVKDRMITFTPQ